MSTAISTRINEYFEFEDIDFAKFSINTVAPVSFRKSVIMVTLGDLSYVTHVDLHQMIEGGMNILRIGSHTTSAQVAEVKGKLNKAARYVAAKYGRNAWPCATCLEIQTRNVTTGLLENTNVKSIFLEENTEVTLTFATRFYDKCNKNRIYVNNPYLVTDVKLGLHISIGEDTIILEVTKINENNVKCVVTKEGHLCDLATLCMKGAKRSRPFITKEDLECVKTALENQVDMITVNYVRHPDTIKKIKKYMGRHVRRPWIASGICTMEGLHNIEEIIRESDVILFSRDKLAYELDKKYFSRMIRIQKYVVGKCREACKPVYLCGQVFQSMLDNNFLSCGDITDVGNAILDGVSGMDLKACKDTNHLKVVMKRLTELCEQIEPFTCNTTFFKESTEGMNLPLNAALTAAMSCVLLANKTQAHVIIVPTVSGRTLYYINKYHPICPIIAVTSNMDTFKSLEMNRNVTPVLYKGPPQKTWISSVGIRLDYAVEYGIHKGWLRYGDNYVTLEKDFEESTFCDVVRIHKVVSKQQELCPDTPDE